MWPRTPMSTHHVLDWLNVNFWRWLWLFSHLQMNEYDWKKRCLGVFPAWTLRRSIIQLLAVWLHLVLLFVRLLVRLLVWLGVWLLVWLVVRLDVFLVVRLLVRLAIWQLVRLLLWLLGQLVIQLPNTSFWPNQLLAYLDSCIFVYMPSPCKALGR